MSKLRIRTASGWLQRLVRCIALRAESKPYESYREAQANRAQNVHGSIECPVRRARRPDCLNEPRRMVLKNERKQHGQKQIDGVPNQVSDGANKN